MKDHIQDSTPHLFVYGSSVGREVVAPLVQGGCVLDGYVARQSLISALRPADPRLLPRLELPSPFLQRMWDGDVAGSLFPALRRLDPVRRRLIVWDLIDERLGAYELPDGSYLTRSVELMRSRRDQEVAALGRHLPFGSDEHFHVWCAALDLFCRALQDAGVPEAACVLLALPWAQTLDDGTPAPASYRMTADEANRLSARYHQQVREQTGFTVVAPDPGELIAARDHRGGPAPFHYTEQSLARLTAAVRSAAGRPDPRPSDAGRSGGAASATGERADEQVRLLVIGGPEVPDAGPVTTLAAVRQPVTCAYGRFIRDEHPVFPALMGSADEVLRQQVRGGLRAHVARFAGRARLVVIDLGDEVHGCYEIAERTYLSRTATRSAPELDATLARDHRLVEFGSAEHLELWRAGLRRCRAEVAQRGPDAQVVVLRCADDQAPAQLLDRYAAVAEREGITVIRAARRGAAAEALAAAAGAAVGERRPATPTEGPARTPDPAPQVLPAPARPHVVQEELGTVDVVSVRKVAAYRRDGELLVGALVDGRPARFVEVRLRDATVLRTVRDDVHRYGSCVLGCSTGSVYGSFRVPNDGVLWRLDPATDRLVAVAQRLAGQSVVRTLADDGAGGVFVTTYPEARLVHVRASGEITDLGTAVPGAAYAWSVAADHEGVWVGSGPQPAAARIARHDAGSGMAHDCLVTPLPAAFCLDGNFVTHLVPTPAALHVGVTFNPSGTVRFLRLDRDTGRWSMSAGPAGRELPAHAVWDAEGGCLWFVADGRLWSVRLEGTQAPEPVDTPGLSAKELVETTALCVVPDLRPGTDSAEPASVVVGVSSGGRIWARWPAGVVTRAQLDLPAAPAQLHQVGATHAGTVLASVFNGTGEFGVVGEKGVETAVGLGQVEATAPAGDRTYVGVYPDVAIHELSDDGVRHVVTLGREASGQDRPLALCVVRDDAQPGARNSARNSVRSGGGGEVTLAVGTAPTYGRLGGSVVLLSLERGRRRVRRRTLRPVPGQAVTALTVGHTPGSLVGGTGVEGGLGAPENGGTARLFTVDDAADVTNGTVATVGRVVPLPVGTRTVGALCLVPDGVLALTVDGDLVLFEPGLAAPRALLRTGLTDHSRWGMRCALLPGPAGTVVGLSAGKLFRVDDALSGWEILCTGVRSVAAIPHGGGPDGEVPVPPRPTATGYVVTDGTAVTRLWVPDPSLPVDLAGAEGVATDPGTRMPVR